MHALLRRLIVAIFQRLAGLSMGLLEVGLLKFYQWVVDTAPPESWSVRTFTYLATGPFRSALTCAVQLVTTFDVVEVRS